MPAVFIIVMDKPVFSIKDEGSDDVFNFSNRITFYWNDGDHNNQIDISSKKLVDIVSDYANKQMAIAKKEGRVAQWKY